MCIQPKERNKETKNHSPTCLPMYILIIFILLQRDPATGPHGTDPSNMPCWNSDTPLLEDPDAQAAMSMLNTYSIRRTSAVIQRLYLSYCPLPRGHEGCMSIYLPCSPVPVDMAEYALSLTFGVYTCIHDRNVYMLIPVNMIHADLYVFPCTNKTHRQIFKFIHNIRYAYLKSDNTLSYEVIPYLITSDSNTLYNRFSAKKYKRCVMVCYNMTSYVPLNNPFCVIFVYLQIQYQADACVGSEGDRSCMIYCGRGTGADLVTDNSYFFGPTKSCIWPWNESYATTPRNTSYRDQTGLVPGTPDADSCATLKISIYSPTYNVMYTTNRLRRSYVNIITLFQPVDPDRWHIIKRRNCWVIDYYVITFQPLYCSFTTSYTTDSHDPLNMLCNDYCNTDYLIWHTQVVNSFWMGLVYHTRYCANVKECWTNPLTNLYYVYISDRIDLISDNPTRGDDESNGYSYFNVYPDDCCPNMCHEFISNNVYLISDNPIMGDDDISIFSSTNDYFDCIFSILKSGKQSRANGTPRMRVYASSIWLLCDHCLATSMRHYEDCNPHLFVLYPVATPIDDQRNQLFSDRRRDSLLGPIQLLILDSCRSKTAHTLPCANQETQHFVRYHFEYQYGYLNSHGVYLFKLFIVTEGILNPSSIINVYYIELFCMSMYMYGLETLRSQWNMNVTTTKTTHDE